MVLDVTLSPHPCGLVRGSPCNSSTRLCAIVCFETCLCVGRNPFVSPFSIKYYSQDSLVFANVTDMFAVLRIHQVTLGARMLLLLVCMERGKKDHLLFFLVPNMLLQTWLLLLFCEAVLIYGAVKLYSSVKWHSSLSRQCPVFLPVRRASCFLTNVLFPFNKCTTVCFGCVPCTVELKMCTKNNCCVSRREVFIGEWYSWYSNFYWVYI